MAAPRGSSLALVAAGLEFETTVVPTASGPGPGPSIVGWLTALVLALEVPASEQAELLERASACGEPGASTTEVEAIGAELFAGLEQRLAAADADVVRSQRRREDRERDLRVNAYTGLGALLGAKGSANWRRLPTTTRC